MFVLFLFLFFFFLLAISNITLQLSIIIIIIFYRYVRVSTYNVYFMIIALIIRLRFQLIFGVDKVQTLKWQIFYSMIIDFIS